MREISIAVLLEQYLELKRSAIVDFIITNQIICPEDILQEHIKRYEEKLLDADIDAKARRFRLDTVRAFVRRVRFVNNRWTVQ